MTPLPGRDVPILDQATGLMTQTWFDYFSAHQKLSQLPDVSTTAPTNNQVLLWNSTTLRWTPGAN